jgi:integrase
LGFGGATWTSPRVGSRSTNPSNTSKTPTASPGLFKPPKTRTSRRTLTLPALAVEALKRHRKEQGEARLKLGLGRAKLVFTREDGSPASVDYVTKALGLLVAEAAVTRITFHGLRHTHISHQLMDGVHVKLVSERAGHANVNVTLTKYAAFLPSLADAAAEGINAWLGAELAKAEAEGAKSVPMRSSGGGEPGVSD